MTTIRTRKARHEGRCPACDRTIVIGQRIAKPSGGDWVHARCLLPVPTHTSNPAGEAGGAHEKGTPQW